MVEPQKTEPPKVESPKEEPKPKVEPPAEPKPIDKPADDPLVIEYAENLKAQLGDLYEKDYDKLPLKERIATMKIVKKTMDKLPTRTEGKPPIEPEPAGVQKVKDHVQRWKEGDRSPKSNSVCTLTLFEKV